MDGKQNNPQSTEQDTEQAVDVFGEPTKKEEPVSEEESKGGGEEKTIEEQLKEEQEARIRLEEQNKTKDENIKEMRNSLKTYKKQVGGGEEGGEGEEGREEGGELFKEIKTSKELSQDEKDEMTDTEIKQYDEIAALKQGMNQLGELIQKQAGQKGGEEESEKGGGEEVKAPETVKSRARELAQNDNEKANKIIQAYNNFQFKTKGLSEEQIKQQVDVAASNVSQYKPPKEQKGPSGGSVKSGGGNDPFGVDSIVEEATSGQQGDYNL